jgi:hypothetical protein
MSQGYVSSAGAMSDPTILGFLNPNPFFDALLRGATIGEAFLFSVPHVDWTISLFGDPLTYCSFPASDIVEEDIINEYEAWNIKSKNLAKTAAQLYKKEEELKSVTLEVVDIITTDPSFETELAAEAAVALLYPANFLHNGNEEGVWQSQLKPLVDTLFDFPRLKYYCEQTNIETEIEFEKSSKVFTVI